MVKGVRNSALCKNSLTSVADDGYFYWLHLKKKKPRRKNDLRQSGKETSNKITTATTTTTKSGDFLVTEN